MFNTYQLDLTYGSLGGSHDSYKDKVIIRMPKQLDFQQMAKEIGKD